MEKLFAALRERHLGYDVVDVRFLLDFSEVSGQRAADLDEAFAKSIVNAKRVDISTLAL